jgi:hypothetical protein
VTKQEIGGKQLHVNEFLPIVERINAEFAARGFL